MCCRSGGRDRSTVTRSTDKTYETHNTCLAKKDADNISKTRKHMQIKQRTWAHAMRQHMQNQEYTQDTHQGRPVGTRG